MIHTYTHIGLISEVPAQSALTNLLSSEAKAELHLSSIAPQLLCFETCMPPGGLDLTEWDVQWVWYH
jgi:hypothetical protein